MRWSQVLVMPIEFLLLQSVLSWMLGFFCVVAMQCASNFTFLYFFQKNQSQLLLYFTFSEMQRPLLLLCLLSLSSTFTLLYFF
jgi:hypothetical protein